MKSISTDEAIKLLKQSDCVVINFYDDSDPVIAGFVGYSEEGDDDSDFVVGGAFVDDIIIQEVTWDAETASMRVPNFDGTMILYQKMKA